MLPCTSTVRLPVSYGYKRAHHASVCYRLFAGRHQKYALILPMVSTTRNSSLLFPAKAHLLRLHPGRRGYNPPFAKTHPLARYLQQIRLFFSHLPAAFLREFICSPGCHPFYIKSHARFNYPLAGLIATFRCRYRFLRDCEPLCQILFGGILHAAESTVPSTRKSTEILRPFACRRAHNASVAYHFFVRACGAWGHHAEQIRRLVPRRSKSSRAPRLFSCTLHDGLGLPPLDISRLYQGSYLT